jgi:hypothetical protein
MPKYSTAQPKANLKLVAKALPAKLFLGGLAPSGEMQPGQYVAACENAWTEPIGNTVRVVWQFRIVDGEHAGTSLRKWLKPTDASGEVSPFGRYAKLCELALGRPLEVTDDLNNPKSIFAGKIFAVFVGYRKTDLPRGGSANDEKALVKKDEKDRLKVHDILAVVEL